MSRALHSKKRVRARRCRKSRKAEPKVADDLDETADTLDDDENPDDLGDDVLDEDDDDTVNLEEIADMPSESDES